jgi:hypothetical protein
MSGISSVGERSLTVYEIHKPATIASNRSRVHSWLSKSPIIVSCRCVMKARIQLMSLQRQLCAVITYLGSSY